MISLSFDSDNVSTILEDMRRLLDEAETPQPLDPPTMGEPTYEDVSAIVSIVVGSVGSHDDKVREVVAHLWTKGIMPQWAVERWPGTFAHGG